MNDDSSEKMTCCQDVGRRRFLTKVTMALSAVIGAIVALPAVAFVLAPLFKKHEEVWRDVGPTSDFVAGTTKLVSFRDATSLPWAGASTKTAAWVRHLEEGSFSAFSVNCTHLGCPVRWIEGGGLFMCPCHGGVYYADGKVAAGPPPKPLPQYQVRAREGRVEVLTAPIPITTVDPLMKLKQKKGSASQS